MGRGAEQLPGQARHQLQLHTLRTSTPSTASRFSTTCGPGSTTCSSGSTCCARDSTCPRYRWWLSSMPTRRDSCARTVAHPDGGTGRAQPQRTSHHVCRPHYREHAKDHRRDQPPTREAVGLQRGAPHHPQGHTEGQEFDTRCHRPRPSRNPNRPSRRKGRKPAPAARAYSDE